MDLRENVLLPLPLDRQLDIRCEAIHNQLRVNSLGRYDDMLLVLVSGYPLLLVLPDDKGRTQEMQDWQTGNQSLKQRQYRLSVSFVSHLLEAVGE